MDQVLWLIPAFPLAGFLLLAISNRFSMRMIAVIGTGSVGAAAVVAIIVSAVFIAAPPPARYFSQGLWTWVQTAGFGPGIGLTLDAPSVIMVLVVTVVGFLIHLYSTGFMAATESSDGYSRYFAYMNLFLGSMLILVMADNLLLLYLGWEGVGLCSYLLIGFWYKDLGNVRAANKAFIVTRIGDASLAVGLFLLFAHLGTLNIPELLQKIPQAWPAGDPLAVAAAALILGGAVGKSAQLPLQVWLPDAMAGPTPVSALIHAATMVTAGVYLIARMHPLFIAAPPVQTAVAAVGVATLLIAAFSALVQTDIKRALAYSTISQIGYMFLALGVGAWSAAFFHFMTHAFFKALLFLSAGVVIQALDGEHDIFKMGGLRRHLPVAFWTFLIGAASLSALPIVTAGFYSKDLILYFTWVSVKGSHWLWGGALLGAFLTAIYAFRLLFLVFFGNGTSEFAIKKRPALSIKIPLVALALLSVIGGFVQLPGEFGGFTLFSDFIHLNLPVVPVRPIGTAEGLFIFADAMVVPIIGVFLAYLLFLRKRAAAERMAETPAALQIHRFWQAGWGFDRLYDSVVLSPFVRMARLNRQDFIDAFYGGLAGLSIALNAILVVTQSGRVRRYAAVIAAGALVMLAIVILGFS